MPNTSPLSSVTLWIVFVSPPCTGSMRAIGPPAASSSCARLTSISGNTRTSVMTVSMRTRRPAYHLARVIGRAGLTHDDNPHLTRIRGFGLDGPCDFLRHDDGLGVVDLIVHHHHADFAARLQRVRALDAGEPAADRLEIVEALDVRRELLAPCARPRRRQRVGRGDD